MSSPASDAPAAEWRWVDPRYNHTTGIDPELEWALGPGRDVFFPYGHQLTYGPQRRWMPLTIELQGISLEEFAVGTGFLDDGPSRTMWQASVRISPLYATGANGARDMSFFTAMVTEGFFVFLRQNERLNKAVLSVTLGLPLGAESLGPALSTSNAGHSQP